MGQYLQDGGASIQRGLEIGATIRDIGIRRQAAQKQLEAENAAKERSDQYKTMLSDYMADPKFNKLQQLQVAFPEQEKAFKPLIEQMDKRQLLAEQSTGIKLTTALKNNNIDLANKILDESIEAAKNSGLDISAFEQVKGGLSNNPTSTLGLVQWLTMHTMTPEEQEKFAKAQQTLEETQQSKELFPSKLRETAAKAGTAESEAIIKGEEAKIAPLKVKADYQKVLESIKDSQLGRELDKQRVAIAAQSNAISREGNALRRQEMQLNLLNKQQEFIDKANEKKSIVYGAYDNTRNIKDTVNRALSFFKTGAAQQAHGPIRSKLPTIDTNVANYEELLNTIGSQAFVQMIPQIKGTGNLSEAEGAKLQSAMSNISLRQGPKQAEKNLIIIKNLSEKALKNTERKYGINIQKEKSSERRNISGSDAAAALGI